MSEAIDLSVCVVNHRTPDLTRACIKSIYDTAGDLSIEVFVVNNTAEPCGLSDVVPPDAPFVFLQNERPMGFSANQNQMLRRARGRYRMCLNSDTIVHPGALGELIRFMDAHPGCAIAGPKLRFGDGTLQPSLRNFPAPFASFVEVSGLWTRLKGKRWIRDRVLLCNLHDRVVESEWLHGACYIVRREAIDQVGLWDEETFTMFGEDADWCWRMRAAGWKILFDPAAEITHLEGRTPYDDRAIALWEGGMRFVRKHYTPLRFLPVRLSAGVAIVLRWVIARNAAERRTFGLAFRQMFTA